jgi:hypothetical protein
MKLKRNLGPDAVLNLLRLWEFVSIQKPKGILDNMDHEDIEAAAKWEGERGAFVQWLLDLRFLDCDGEWCQIHDWEEHNPWAYHSDKRKKKAKKAARARWGDGEEENNATSNPTSNATSMPVAMLNSDLAYAPSPIPSPSPKPVPKPSTKTSSNAGSQITEFSEMEKSCREEAEHLATELSKRFWPDAYKAMNSAIQKWNHICAVRDALKAVDWYRFNKPSACKPWGVFNAQLKIKSGNYWEREHTKDVNRKKDETPTNLEEILNGFTDIPSDCPF